MHTRPDGDLENLAIEKCTARDLKIRLLHSASHGCIMLHYIYLFDFLNARRPMQFLHVFTLVPHMH